ncbi:hypothetical protein AKJ50_01110 [candidate division MSBL1 archaeon SCGC-AAA382A13]|uniref:4Fe-4S ferredoxin-type domain-containing protein n=1 Tax=candidate division MSBL1 archaeon SCGC-AAA382A13 TaxID=1698279 RepID=A0A133VG18_9EURY|nr:hypothetical protein AKJ50_01110 [candidate division MSBL1 archaeon SCGC-AAA382A13]
MGKQELEKENNSRETGKLCQKTLEEEDKLPPMERLEQGPVAVVECVEDIPCDPCVEACPVDAIEKKTLTSAPEIRFEDCTGCGKCITSCPGLAIFVIDYNHEEDMAAVSLPYEFLPVPEEGEKVTILDRSGNMIGKGDVVNVRKSNNTHVVKIIVGKEIVMNARAIRVME